MFKYPTMIEILEINIGEGADLGKVSSVFFSLFEIDQT